MEARVIGPLAEDLLTAVVLDRHEDGELNSPAMAELGDEGITIGLEVGESITVSVGGACTLAKEETSGLGMEGGPEMSPCGMMVNSVGTIGGLKAKERAVEAVVVVVGAVMGMGGGTRPMPKVVSWYGAPSGRKRPRGGTDEKDFPLLTVPGHDLGLSSSSSSLSLSG